jgi:hypothetical protein
MPQSTQKKLKRCGIPRLLRTMLREARAKGKFWCACPPKEGIKICLFAQMSTNKKINPAKSREAGETQKIKRCQGAESSLNKTNFTTVY